MTMDKLSNEIISVGIEVHKELGPGLLESVYEACLAYELTERGICVERQKAVPVKYKKVYLDCGFRLDLLVENKIIVELKAVEDFAPIHHAQVITYLRLFGCNLGLLLNFNTVKLKDGIKRIVYNYLD